MRMMMMEGAVWQCNSVTLGEFKYQNLHNVVRLLSVSAVVVTLVWWVTCNRYPELIALHYN